MTIEKKGWFQRIKETLKKSSDTLSVGVQRIFQRGKLDAASLEELEEVLLKADLGVSVTQRLLKSVQGVKAGEDFALQAREKLVHEISQILMPVEHPLPSISHQPQIIMMVGVNGSGKTTTVAKLAHLWLSQGHRVRLAACDTFRAAATEQLAVWADRVGVPITTGAVGADPAAVAFQALEETLSQGEDCLLIDTAGRLHNNLNLMEELSKIARVITKRLPGAPHDVLMVLDATVGQNAYQQVELFHKAVPLTGIIVAKLEGSAKAGVVVGVAEKYRIPFCGIGCGETVQDLAPFQAQEFAAGLLGEVSPT